MQYNVNTVPVPPRYERVTSSSAGLLELLKTPFHGQEILKRAAELFVSDAKSQWAIQSRIALVHNERGAQLFNHAAARHAAVEFSRAIECNPRVAAFYVNRAQATLELNRYDLARDDVLAALKLKPSDEKAQRMLQSLTPGT